MPSRKKLGTAGKGIVIAGILLGNVLLGIGILDVAGQNIFGALLIALGVAALVPAYYFFKFSGEKIGIGFLNPVPMFLATAHEKEQTEL